MFATLVGSDRDTAIHADLSAKLVALAEARGYRPPDTRLRIRPDQTPLHKWQLECRGPADEQADFFLAVTAPAIPGFHRFRL